LCGSVVSETSISTLIKGSAYLSLFLLVSAYVVSYLVAIPIFGWLTYFVLTGVYCLGMIGTFGYAGGGAD